MVVEQKRKKREKKPPPTFSFEEAGLRSKPKYLVAIDPGPEFSAYLILEAREPLVCLLHGFVPNLDVLQLLEGMPLRSEAHLVVEMVSSYGMAVGWETFETVYWIGRFCQAWADDTTQARIYRAKIRSHICATARAGDAEIWRALVDRFGPSKDRAIGSKKSPGPLYGITSHERSALAVGVTYWDMLRGVVYPTPPDLSAVACADHSAKIY